MANKRKKQRSTVRTSPKVQRLEFSPEPWHLRVVVGLCAVGFLIYANTFTGTFHFDDLAVIVNNPAIRDLWDVGAIFSAFNTRVVGGWTFAVNYALGQLNVTGYHFFNIWLHVCNAVLVYTLAHQLLGFEKDKRSPFHQMWIAVAAALVFLVHPIGSQAVNYIWQRVTLLAVFFYLSTVVLYIHARVHRAPGYYRAALLGCLLAMFSKEIACTLPFMILLIEGMFLRRVCADRRSWLWTFPFLLMLVIIPLMLQRSDGLSLKIMRPHAITAGVSEDVISRKDYVLTQVNVIRTYLRLFVYPVRQSIDHDYPLASQTGWGVWWASLVLLFAILAAGVFVLRSNPMVSFGIFWFFITIMVESLVTSADVLVEHRLYLPMIGSSLVFALLMHQWVCLRNVRMATVVVLCIVVALGMMTVMRNTVWQNDLKLWDDAIQKFPNKARSYNNRGVIFKGINSLDLALRDLNRAIEIEPNYPEALYNRGGIYRMTGDHDRAVADYARVVELEPENPRAYDALGSIYRRKNMLDEALVYFTTSITLNPKNPEVFSSRAYIYQKQGRDDLALADYTRAIDADPGFVYAYNNRGNLYLKKGDAKAAMEDYDRALRIQPQFAEAYLNRAVAKFQLGLLNEAQKDMKEAQALGVVPKPGFVRQLNEALEN